MIEVRIGVVESPKELALEMDIEFAELAKKVDVALSSASAVLWLTDKKGKQVGVPSSKVAYVEIDPQTSGRPLGFGTG